MTLHIGAQPGEIAQTVLMPGDPLRAKWAAAQFLSDARCVSQTRGMLAYTGTWQGHRVSIHASGMGMASMSIYAHELLHDYGARTLIRVGSTGAMQDHVNLRDIVLAQACTTISTPSQPLFREVQFAPCADFGLLRAAHDAACAQGAPVHVGNVYSSDVFYDERPDLNAVMTRHGVLAVEMEAAELYCVAARFKARALAVLTVSDHLARDEHLTPADREQSFGQMFEIALQAAFV